MRVIKLRGSIKITLTATEYEALKAVVSRGVAGLEEETTMRNWKGTWGAGVSRGVTSTGGRILTRDALKIDEDRSAVEKSEAA